MKEQKTTFLILYDYILLQDGTENLGTNKLFEEYLTLRKLDYEVFKFKFPSSIKSLIIKFFVTSKYLINKDFSAVVAYNFVNAVYSWILKILFFKNYNVIFASLDFSTKRFDNFFLDKIYVFF
jgi:hypothetical protein